MKSFKIAALSTTVITCTMIALFCFWAASVIQHNPGWELVQGGVVFIGICYAMIAIVMLNKFAGKA